MGLVKKWDIERTWGSHQALLKATIAIMEPESAIECGCGNYSTPHILGTPKHVIIEHDSIWAAKMVKDLPVCPVEWKVKTFNAKNPTRINELPSGEYESICNYYYELGEQSEPVDLLFVDTFTACRVPAVLNLGESAEYIIIHDMEPPGPEVYEWDRLNSFFDGWNKYIHKPMGHVGNGHQIPWTGLYSKEPLPLDELNEGMKEESIRLWNEHTPIIETDCIYD